MHSLGHTRSSLRRTHLLQTPDTFVRTGLPGLSGGAAIVHTGAAAGAAFAQYTVEFAAGGRLAGNGLQRFVYVHDGELTLRAGDRTELLTAGAYAYLPASLPHELSAAGPARATVIERPAHRIAGTTPAMLRAHIGEVASAPLADDPDLQVQTLLPESPELNFAVNVMTYQPGASLAMVEVHVMEHGLLMLEGGGIYRLSDYWYPVAAGDFIWMAPFCPQWFGALGKRPAKYLIYKDTNQAPLRVQESAGEPRREGER